jgi:hypothetical protein
MKEQSSTPGVGFAAAVVVAIVGAVVFVGTLVVTLPLALLHALVIRDMWQWFAVPALGLKPISVGLAFGLNLLAHALYRQAQRKHKPSETPWVDFIGYYIGSAVGSLTVWGLARLVAHYWTQTL